MPRTKTNADALTKMLNIIWSHYMVLGTLHDRCWFGWAGFGEKTANTKFPLIPFPPNSVFFRLIPFLSAYIPVFPPKFRLKMPRPKACSTYSTCFEDGPPSVFLDSKVQTSWEFNPVEIGPIGDVFKKTPTEEKKCRRIGCSMCPMDLLGIAKYWEGMKSLTKVY